MTRASILNMIRARALILISLIASSAALSAATTVRQAGDFLEIQDAHIGTSDTHLLIRMDTISSVHYTPARQSRDKPQIT